MDGHIGYIVFAFYKEYILIILARHPNQSQALVSKSMGTATTRKIQRHARIRLAAMNCPNYQTT
jgi:hypothetical protein